MPSVQYLFNEVLQLVQHAPQHQVVPPVILSDEASVESQVFRGCFSAQRDIIQIAENHKLSSTIPFILKLPIQSFRMARYSSKTIDNSLPR